MAKISLAHALCAGTAATALLLGSPSIGQSKSRDTADRASVSSKGLSQAEIDARVDNLLAQMTVEEKAGQLTQLFSFAKSPMNVQVEKQISTGRLGSVLFVTDPQEVNRLQRLAMENSRLKIPLLFGFDVIHGLRTAFPVPIAMAASWDPSLAEDAQAMAAREARAVGVMWTFAPMVDIGRDQRWGRVVEGAGEDPYLGSAMAAAQVRGFQGVAIGQKDRILAGPKHFVGYGAALGGRDYDEVDISDSQLWNVYLPPFKAAIDAGAANIMSAYMAVNGIPAAGNRYLLGDVLRDKLGFKGFVVSDADAVKNLKTHGLSADAEASAADALNGGVDMEMATFGPAFNQLPQALAAGKIDEARLDAAVRRILEVKIRLGLFEHPYVDAQKSEQILSDPETRKAARIAAERSAVLLRNDGDLLPLSAEKVKSVAVIGFMADSAPDGLGSWIFSQNKPYMTSILEGIRARLPKSTRVVYKPGVARPKRLVPSPFAGITPAAKAVNVPDAQAGIRDAVGAAQASDVTVLVLGETPEMSGEAASRASLKLPGDQQALLKAVLATGKPVVVVLLNGRALDLEGTSAPAILDMWYPGSQAGPATANLLFGDAVPGGKLPFTWPASAEQSPQFYSHLNSHQPENASKRYWDQGGAPAFAFGHGLSYTRFAYSNVKVSQDKVAPGQALEVTADITNNGSRIGDEVAQLYIHQRSGTAARPVRELKGFQRLTLKPGQTVQVRFQLRPEDLRYWNSLAKDWVADTSVFDVALGGSSAAAFQTTFTVTKSGN